MKCSQLLIGIVPLGVVVLVYLTTSVHCNTDQPIPDETNLIFSMGLRQLDDRLLYNDELKNDTVEPNKTLCQIFSWPSKSDIVIYQITRIEVENKGKGGYVHYSDGGPSDADVELYVESEKGVELDVQILIYGYERGLHRF